MKIYSASLVAFMPDKSPEGKPGAFPSTSVAIFFAENIDDAAEKAKELVFDGFKESDGYFGHSVHIISMPEEMFLIAEGFKKEGRLDLSVEDDKDYEFGSTLDDDVIS